jgi:hypothetical protein
MKPTSHAFAIVSRKHGSYLCRRCQWFRGFSNFLKGVSSIHSDTPVSLNWQMFRTQRSISFTTSMSIPASRLPRPSLLMWPHQGIRKSSTNDKRRSSLFSKKKKKPLSASKHIVVHGITLRIDGDRCVAAAHWGNIAVGLSSKAVHSVKDS